MSNLTDLVLYVGHGSDEIIMSIFDILAFPNLNQLVIIEQEDATWELGLTPAITHSHLLTKLCIDFPVPASQWDELLGGLPCLVELISPCGRLMMQSTIRSIARDDTVKGPLVNLNLLKIHHLCVRLFTELDEVLREDFKDVFSRPYKEVIRSQVQWPMITEWIARCADSIISIDENMLRKAGEVVQRVVGMKQVGFFVVLEE
ncbi:hypothetical protein Hypma_014115 [Hypsizygus marmoreus]|uniref:Uncharacterized protein n=1 Tax=Hypsizygus marmoreus TaxID=39966 RepID=A0A369K7U8_HYPMA|nr:hypothetical protein Hypma_014115 [Hypsizygus marmoreus]